MATGIAKTRWSIEDIGALIDMRVPTPALGKRGPRGSYKKRARE